MDWFVGPILSQNTESRGAGLPTTGFARGDVGDPEQRPRRALDAAGDTTISGG